MVAYPGCLSRDIGNFQWHLRFSLDFFAKYVDKNLGLFEPILEILVWVGSLEFFDQDV